MPHAIREALAAFRRSPLLVGLSAAMVALALYVVGLFGLAAHNIHLAIQQLEERVEVVAYLRDDAAGSGVAVARAELRALPEVADVRHVTKAEALERARDDLPEFGELFTEMDVNPLPASLEVTLRPGHRTSAAVERIAAQADAYPVVEDVRYGRDWLDKVFLIRRMGAVGATILGGGFAAVAALIIGAAVRIAIFARRDEIEIMRLVGARNGFIRRPFLIEGLLTGLMGGIGALGLTWGTQRALDRALFDVAWIPEEWVLAGIAAGTLFGAVASGLAVRRHLRDT